MKRKSLLTGAILLSIIYSFAVVGTIILGAASVIYFFAGESIQIITDLFLPFLKPFMVYGKVYMLVFIGLTIIASIFLLIISTRFMKYAGINKELFQKKKPMMIFYLIVLLATIGGGAYWLVTNILATGITGSLIVNIVLIVLLVIHLLSFILFSYGISKEIGPDLILEDKVEQQKANVIASVNEKRPAIYTAGLDEDEVKTEDTEVEETKVQEVKKPKLQESESSQKLIESIGKLDQMRKEGAISPKEYTRLRGQLIKNFVVKK